MILTMAGVSTGLQMEPHLTGETLWWRVSPDGKPIHERVLTGCKVLIDCSECIWFKVVCWCIDAFLCFHRSVIGKRVRDLQWNIATIHAWAWVYLQSQCTTFWITDLPLPGKIFSTFEHWVNWCLPVRFECISLYQNQINWLCLLHFGSLGSICDVLSRPFLFCGMLNGQILRWRPLGPWLCFLMWFLCLILIRSWNRLSTVCVGNLISPICEFHVWEFRVLRSGDVPKIWAALPPRVADPHRKMKLSYIEARVYRLLHPDVTGIKFNRMRKFCTSFWVGRFFFAELLNGRILRWSPLGPILCFFMCFFVWSSSGAE